MSSPSAELLGCLFSSVQDVCVRVLAQGFVALGDKLIRILQKMMPGISVGLVLGTNL